MQLVDLRERGGQELQHRSCLCLEQEQSVQRLSQGGKITLEDELGGLVDVRRKATDVMLRKKSAEKKLLLAVLSHKTSLNLVADPSHFGPVVGLPAQHSQS